MILNETARRILMMIGIVSVGTMLIFIDAPVYMTLGATLAFGIIMAMGLGVLRIEDLKIGNPLKRYGQKKTEKPGKEKKPRDKKDKPEKAEKRSFRPNEILSRFKKEKPATETRSAPEKKKEKSRFSAGLSASLASFQGRVRNSRDEKHSEKIDSLLKSAIEEPVTPSPEIPDETETPSLTDDDSALSDEFGSFDEEDFASLNSLEIEGEDLSLTFDTDTPTESGGADAPESMDQNLDDEIQSILLAENALDPEDDILTDPLAEQHGDDISLSSGEQTFDSDVFFVQGIEDGLDEESFITIPEPSAETQPRNTLMDTLDELDNIHGFEKTSMDDEFSDFESINLDELDNEDLSIETDEIIIEDEVVDETGILPDDFIPASDEANTSTTDARKTGGTNSLFETPEGISPEIDNAISFSGKGEYDDILSVLESDIKKTKKGPEPSLVRDMKDVHVEAKDLAEELETVLTLMGGKKRQPDE